jgi:hypothetical protein
MKSLEGTRYGEREDTQDRYDWFGGVIGEEARGRTTMGYT